MTQRKGISGTGMHTVRSPFSDSWQDGKSLYQLFCCLAPWHPSSHWTTSTASTLGGQNSFAFVTYSLFFQWYASCSLYSLHWNSVSFFVRVYYSLKTITIKLQGIPFVCSSSFSQFQVQAYHAATHVDSKAWKGPSHILKFSCPTLHESSCITGLEGLCSLEILQGLFFSTILSRMLLSGQPPQ